MSVPFRRRLEEGFPNGSPSLEEGFSLGAVVCGWCMSVHRSTRIAIHMPRRMSTRGRRGVLEDVRLHLGAVVVHALYDVGLRRHCRLEARNVFRHLVLDLRDTLPRISKLVFIYMAVRSSRHRSVPMHMSIHMSARMSVLILYTCQHNTSLYTSLYSCLYTCLYTCLYSCCYTCPYTCLCTCLYTRYQLTSGPWSATCPVTNFADPLQMQKYIVITNTPLWPNMLL